MSESEPVVFKVEDTIWNVMKKGIKTWDARMVDLDDPRFLRLFRTHWEENRNVPGLQINLPDESYICFLNRLTGQTLQFRYRGSIHTNWSPGWCFFLLGSLVATLDSDGAVI